VQLQRLPCPIEAETRHCTRRKFFIGRLQQFIQVGLGNKPERSKAACIGATLVIENSEPNFRKGWEAVIRSSRLKFASTPRRDIRRPPFLAANRARKPSYPDRDRTRPKASENW
jgi:hypothetical protein